MDNSNNDLLDRIIGDEPPASSKNDQLRKALARWFEGRRNYAMFYMTFVVLISLVALIPGAFVIGTGVRDVYMLFLATAGIVIGVSLNVLMKLWYWTVDNKISVVKELKLMQLRMAEAGEEGGASPVDQTALDRILPEKFLETQGSFFARLSPRTARWIVLVALVAGAFAIGAATQAIVPKMLPRAGVEQHDEYHFDSSGMVHVRSELAFHSFRDNQIFRTLALPYGTGQITAVTFEGKPLNFGKTDWRHYEVQLPIYPFGVEIAPVIVVDWTFPMDSLLPVEDGRRTLLSSLLPVEAYSLDAVLDGNSGYAFSNGKTSGSSRAFARRGFLSETQFGWCTLDVVPRTGQNP